MSEAPPFWFQKPGVASWLMSPIGLAYGLVAARRMLQKPTYVSALPTICVGNFIAGGAGKTPTAVALAERLRALDMRPAFLSRGYGGSVTGPLLVDPAVHNAHDVGDEALLLARHAPIVVSANRMAGAKMLEEYPADVIVMDDGFQNPSLHKDAALVVVNSRRGVGNGFVIPAGPMRAGLTTQMACMKAMIVIGDGAAGINLVRRAARMAKPVFPATLVNRNPEDFSGRRVLAFAGIADPEKFYASLEEAGAEIVDRQSFPDHHPFRIEECRDLMERAKAQHLILATTEKDRVRLSRSGDVQQALHDQSSALEITIAFDNPRSIDTLLERVLHDARVLRSRMDKG